jgi:hypothetical protein
MIHRPQFVVAGVVVDESQAGVDVDAALGMAMLAGLPVSSTSSRREEPEEHQPTEFERRCDAAELAATGRYRAHRSTWPG